MNNVNLIGRLTRDPDIRWTQGQEQKCTARFTLAVDRGKNQKTGERTADFISCAAFDKRAEFIDKYVKQGDQIGVTGSIRTGSYTDRDGRKVYTTDVYVNTVTFCQKQGDKKESTPEEASKTDDSGFMDIPDGVQDESLPFH